MPELGDSLLKSNRDTSPLRLGQLSDDELAMMLYIERRLYDAQDTSWPSDPEKGPDVYRATVQDRYPRALLLDGGRGTGKTALLLTLVDRWHHWSREGVEEEAAYRERIDQVCKDPKFARNREHQERDYKIPSHITVVGRILDFDPLPPEMPIIAGIMQAWEPLAKRYDELLGQKDPYYDEGGRLMDSWHRLFQMAAVGWTAIPRDNGLIDRVLDREEQVQDWQRLDHDWRSFVELVIKRGQRLQKSDRPQDSDKLPTQPVFVIMIDDVDLQVGRIRELLPALRLLYHPRVFFLVAAHRLHMMDMLKLDFLGQQRAMAQLHGTAGPFVWDDVDNDRWSHRLATSAFDKVFPKRNRWELRRLSVLEFLAFPTQVRELPEKDPESRAAVDVAGDDLSPGSTSGIEPGPRCIRRRGVSWGGHATGR